jgi:hypothetical protein
MKPSKLKLLIGFGLVLSLVFPFVGLAQAADLEITCSSGNCSSTGDKPLFLETNIFPGWSKTKVVKAINNYDQGVVFATKIANLAPAGGLSDVLTISIKKRGEAANIYEDNLTNLKNYGYLPLSTFSGPSQEYDFTVKIQESAGNDYQGLSTSFDLNLGFEVSPIEETPTTPGATATSPPACAASVPSAPINLTATTVSSSVIGLSWTAPSETVTHYNVSYGLSSGSYLYGNSNIGNVTNYVVSELSSGTTYYFIVYAVNNCATSNASNEASATTAGVLGVFAAGGPTTGFEVLGEKSPGEIAGGEITEKEITGEVMGAEQKPTCWWWLILSLTELALLTIFYLLSKGKDKIRHYWWLASLISAALAFVGDQYIAHRSLIPSRFCSFMWLWAIIAALIPSLIFRPWKNKS